MGVFLTPLVDKMNISLERLRGKVLAVDGNGMLYDFLALFRKPDGSLLKDSRGDIVSHLHGVLYAAVRLGAESGMKPVFVFDGEPPALKNEEIERRRALKERYARQYEEALGAGLMELAYSKAVKASRVTSAMIDDARRLLSLLGIPHIGAPSEGEAQAAFMVRKGDAWAVAGRDYDTLLLGGLRMVSFTYPPGRKIGSDREMPDRPVAQLIDLDETLARHGIVLDQLIDIAILIGNDFNHGVRGMSTRNALDLVKKYRNIEGLPPELRFRVSGNYREVRDFFRNPPVTEAYHIRFGSVDENGLYDFLCDKRDFAPGVIENTIERLRQAGGWSEG